MSAEQPEPPISGEKRRFVTNTVVNGSAQFASMLASLVFMPLLVKAFGLVDYGLFMLASSLTAYASLLDFGVGSALTKMVAEYTATDDRRSLSGAISSALLFYSVVGIIVALAMGVLGALSDVVFNVDPGSGSILRNMLWLGALFQLWYWPASTARHILAGLQRYDVLAGAGLVTTVLSIAATLTVLAIGEGPLVLVGLNGIAMVIASIIGIVAAVRLVGRPKAVFWAPSRQHFKAIFAFSWAVFVIQVADALFYQQTDRVVLGIFAGAASVALYEAAAKFNALLIYLSGLSVATVLPLASSMDAEGRHASLRALLLRGTKYGAALIAPLSIVVIVFANQIIAIWLGPDFEGQGLVAQVLVVPHILVCLGLMGDAIIISRGRLSKRVPYIFVQALLNVIISVALVGRYGVLGVAIGTTAAHLIDFPIHMRFLLRETEVSLADWMREVVVPVYPLLLVPLGIGLGLATTGLSASLGGIVLASGIAVSAYWASLFLFALSPTEKSEVRYMIAAVRTRLARADR